MRVRIGISFLLAVSNCKSLTTISTAGGDKDEAEASLGDDVKNGVEDGFAVGGDGAGAFSKDPDDGVEGPRGDGEAHDVVVGHDEVDVGKERADTGVGAEDRSNVAFAVVHVVVNSTVLALAKVVDDGDEGEDGEAEEDPLVAAADGGADEAGDDHEHVVEEEVVPDVVFHVADVGESVKHHRGGDDPVKVASVVELTAIEAAGVEAVVGGHGEVGEGGNEGYHAADEGRLSVEGVDLLAGVGTNAPVNGAISSVGNVVEPQVAVDEVDGRKEEEEEANPKSNGARSADAVVAGVDGVSRLEEGALRLVGRSSVGLDSL